MMKVQKIPFTPSYIKDNGVFTINFADIPLPENFTVVERGMVYLPPGKIAGNHTHPRVDVLVGLGDGLEFVWQDEEGRQHVEKMQDGEQLYVMVTAPHVPHAVRNVSSGSIGTIIELASEAHHDVQRVMVIE